ncbi:uncharacterized protein [Arachis hypogaea]|uniref:uncharacterized protein n=1 Tax=Arachis hypogaea TaxID=3818 RepID=UPI000DEC5F28
MIESERLSSIKHNQPRLRVDKYIALHESLVRGEASVVATGQRIILPSSFTGSPRYMFNNCKDAFAIYKYAGLKAQDRPDIISRIFNIKLGELIANFKHGRLFGKITAYDIDKLISAEIPNKIKRPKLYAAVEKYMIYGPCGMNNSKSPCMLNGQCSKYYPKPFRSRTMIDDGGFHKYKRMDNGRIAFAIKYLFKYVHKGNDRINASFFQTNVDEGTFGHQASFSSANEHPVAFRDYENIIDVIDRVDLKLTKLLAWMIANRLFPYGHNLTYSQFPKKFVWKDDISMWMPRKQGFSIGRLSHVPRGNGEDYYLRLLLNIQKRCLSYVHLCIVNGVVYGTFKEACYALGLL